MFGFNSGQIPAGMPMISVLTPAALAAVPVGTLANGQQAWVQNMWPGGPSGLYYLEPLLSAGPDSIYIVPTLDDAGRQWAQNALNSGEMFAFYAPADTDLKVIGSTLVVPRMNKHIRSLQVSVWIKTSTLCTVAPTLSAGVNGPNYDNQANAATPAGFTSQAVNTTIFLATAALNAPILDLSADGLHVHVTVGATATALTGRLAVIGQLFVP
jgi:hypothetical protein